MLKYKYIIVYVSIVIFIGLSFAMEQKDTLKHIKVSRKDQYIGVFKSPLEFELEINKLPLSKDSILIRIYAVQNTKKEGTLEAVEKMWSSDWIAIKRTEKINLKDFNVPIMKQSRWTIGLYEYEKQYDGSSYMFIEFDTTE